MKFKAIQKKHTGKNLVLLNPGIKGITLFKAAKKQSVRLAHFSDFSSMPDKFRQAFTDGDGIYFETLNVAVTNFDKEDQIIDINRLLKGNAIITTEPERYVYKIEGNSRIMHESRRSFTDDDKASWGIKATLAIKSELSGKGINIAVLDTGLFKEHNDLKGRKITTRKFVSGGTAGDADGHGTHCVGVACGHKDEAGTRYGVAYKSNIFCGKVLNDDGEGTDSGILAGIEWALLKNCRVISMSLGAASEIGEPYSETYEAVAKRAMKQGSLIVAAAGNESSRPDYIAPVGHPANCPSVLAVGAVDRNLKIARFSCGGLNTNGGQIDIVAPGVSVYSMVNIQNGHDKWDGTSMATPFVSGIAGLLFEQNKDATPLEIWSLITQLARRLTISSLDAGSGLAQAPFEL
jgi:subtilisin family serine protease